MHDRDDANPTGLDMELLSDEELDRLPPLQSLIVEVLTCRVRLGETCWPFQRKPAITKALCALESRDIVHIESGGDWWKIFPGIRLHDFLERNVYVAPLLSEEQFGIYDIGRRTTVPVDSKLDALAMSAKYGLEVKKRRLTKWESVRGE